MPKIPQQLITYCSNIHPGESWAETFSALREHIPVVKAALSPDKPFPIGLRLSHRAAEGLTTPECERFIGWLQDNQCFVPTINGFPYGAFHNKRIKERVYQPDWSSPDRSAYTIRLANLLAEWLPEGVTGSISTVPLGFKGAVHHKDLPYLHQQLTTVLTRLKWLHQERGKKIILALEPEPGCLLETTEEVCRFFDEMDCPPELRNYLGLCYDCCHQAIAFEEPADSLGRLANAGIRIAKVQVSSALKWFSADPQLAGIIDEPCYLHQVAVRHPNGSISRYADLPEAVARHQRMQGDEWRCHFHVPVFLAGNEAYGTTRAFIEHLLPLLPADMLLEVETYTWDVLPPELRCGSVSDSIIRELQWLEGQINATHRCP